MLKGFFPFYQSPLYFCMKNPKENFNFFKVHGSFGHNPYF
jgi:hypothetical protein